MVDTGRGEASGFTLGLLLAWWEDETPTWKPVKDEYKIQYGQYLVSQSVTTRVRLEGTSGKEKMKEKGPSASSGNIVFALC